MKKNIIKLLVIAFTLALATSSFAATTINSATTLGGGPFRPSTNVTISALSTTTAYTASSCHLAGSLEYQTIGGNVSGDASTITSQTIPDQSNNTECEPTDPTTAGTAAF